MGCYPTVLRSTSESRQALQHFFGGESCGRFYTDNALELLKAAAELGVTHDAGTPGRPSANGLAERSFRKAVEGARTCLLQAGLPPSWWSYAIQCFAFASNIEIIDGDSEYNKRHKSGQSLHRHVGTIRASSFLPTYFIQGTVREVRSQRASINYFISSALGRVCWRVSKKASTCTRHSL